MQTHESKPVIQDDLLTICALAALACMAQSLLHEGLGHGVAAWLSRAHRVTVSTVAMDADVESRWIEAAGTLVNLAAAAVFWFLLRILRPASPQAHFLLVLLLSGNLFAGTGYFFFSGVAGIGDWQQIIRDLHPYGLYRAGLVVLGVASYMAAAALVARELRPFGVAGDRQRTHQRVKRLTWTSYFTQGALNGVAGLLNPAGPIYVLLSALPATLGAQSALLWIRYYVAPPEPQNEAGPITRSYGWIAAALLLALAFILIPGRGLTFRR